jgi:hypothetical protein
MITVLSYPLEMFLLAYLHWHMIQWGLAPIFTWLNGWVYDKECDGS